MIPTWPGTTHQFRRAIYGNMPREEDFRANNKRRTAMRRDDSTKAIQVSVPAIVSQRIYPIVSENTLITVDRLPSISLSYEHANVTPIMDESNMASGTTVCRSPVVYAAGVLNQDSSTEIIDVDKLSQKNTSVIQYVEIADVRGRLYCVDGLISTSCWLKTVALAKDCQSCNVLLTDADTGVFLKTTRNIKPGEPLQMWFTDKITVMLNMFLPHTNIKGGRYVCHMCNKVFENPNPLKMHMALKCDQLDKSYIWTLLARKFASEIPSRRSLYSQTAFTFQLTSPATLPINEFPPILSETMYAGVSMKNDSPNSNQLSPHSLAQPSSNSPLTHISSSSNQSPLAQSPASSEQVTPENLAPRRSAFQPYAQERIQRNERQNERTRSYSNVVPRAASSESDVHAAHVESIVSRMGRSKEGHWCIYCGKLYTRKYGLKIHIRTHTGYKPLKCQFCQRAFGDPSNLNKHVRLHADGDTPYKCNLCSKILVRRRDLERHLRSRHQQNLEYVSEESSEANDD